MRALKIAFGVCLAIWIGGALLTIEYASPAKRLEMLAYGPSDHDVAMMNLRGIAINLFGLLTIATGLMLGGAWLYRQSQSSSGKGSPKVSLEANKAEHDAGEGLAPSTASHPINSETLSCDFTGWGRDGNRILQEWTYRGQGVNHRLVIELTLEQGTVAALRFVHIWLFPANEFEGSAEVQFHDAQDSVSTGWLASRMVKAAGNATLFNIENREGADIVWRMLTAGRDLHFSVRLEGEELLDLPLPNGHGIAEHKDAILKTLKPSIF